MSNETPYWLIVIRSPLLVSENLSVVIERMSENLANKVVLITGASSGFGADAARLFAREGCHVVLSARRLDKLNDLAEQIRTDGGQAFVIGLDVTEQSQIDQAVQTVLDTFGRIDILFNNAGFGRLDWLETLEPVVDIDIQIDVNLRGLIQVTRAILPSMLSRRSGTIINMSSIAGLIPAPMYSIYAATKYGIRGFTNALRREVASLGIKVCGIYPGPAVTEFSQHSGSDSAIKKNLKTPGWIYMTSAYVARRIVGLAKNPRRALVIPWWFTLLIGIDTILPGLVDWLLQVAYVQRFHNPAINDQP
jgi:NADP-dependent 3-hydroxy acid dehydrogenase YdfG